MSRLISGETVGATGTENGDLQESGSPKRSKMNRPLPTECVSPNIPRGASSLRRPLRIFSSFGNGGKNRGGGG